MEQLTEKECLTLIELLGKLPKIHIPEERLSLLIGLYQDSLNTIPSSNSAQVHLSNIVDTLGSEAYFKLNDGTYPIITVIRNAQRMVSNLSPLYKNLQDFLDSLCQEHNIVLQKQIPPIIPINIFLNSLEDFIQMTKMLPSELQVAALAFLGHLLPQECREYDTSITSCCDSISLFMSLLKPSNSPPFEVIANGAQLEMELTCFVSEAKVLCTQIHSFCETDALILEQSGKTLDDIQQYTKRLIQRCSSMAGEAEKLRDHLGNLVAGSATEMDFL